MPISVSSHRNRNNQPAFGCIHCQTAKSLLMQAGKNSQEATRALDDIIRLMHVGDAFCRRTSTHEALAEKALKMIKNVVKKFN